MRPRSLHTIATKPEVSSAGGGLSDREHARIQSRPEAIRMARIYWRSHGDGPPRAWGDFTSLGHGREPLIEPGSPKRLGTTSSTIAAKVFADRVKELEQVKVDRAVLGVERRMTLGAFVPQHLALR